MEYVLALDGLRAIAVLMVLVTHFWNDPPGWIALNRLAAFGWAGVDLFFVLSGFLITRILLASRSSAGYFSTFYARRTLRIFPLYYLVLAMVFVGLPLVTALPPRVVEDRALYVLYLSNVALAAGGWQLFMLDITWSLAIEEQFYLVWPTVVRYINRTNLMRLCVAVMILAPLTRFVAFGVLGWRWVHMLTPFRADAFAIGGLICLIKVTPRIASAVLTLGATLLSVLVLSNQLTRDSWAAGTFGYSLTALTAGAALVLAPRARWLTAPPLRHIGTVSYGMYLLHPICMAASSVAFATIGVDIEHPTGWPLTDALLSLTVLTAIVVAVASECFAIYEKPFLRLKRYFPSGNLQKERAPALEISSTA
jgi:peptidoglycan/LPS O-acetylase OafA/YrhL